MSHTPYSVALILPAAGRGTRLGNPVPKAFIEVGGKPVLAHTLERFLQLPYFQRIIIAVSADMMPRARSVCEALGPDSAKNPHGIPLQLVEGGSERLYSIQHALGELGDEDLVAVHDAVRPLVDAGDIRKVCDKAWEKGAALLMAPSSNTLKQIDAGSGRIEKTLDRRRIWQILTPQVFRAGLMRKMYAKALQEHYFGTDDASLAEHAGYPVYGVEGSPDNIKITYKQDLKRFMSMHQNTAAPRIGYGYDSHRLAPGRRLILGGVEIPWEQGLDGHSDADVLTHAIIDALLGALALGDIGSHFPDTEAAYKDADSRVLLQRTCEKITECGYRIGNIDATIVAQKPKLRNYIDQMRANIAEDCGCVPQQVSVKATTAEHLGALGRSEGMSASAVSLLMPADEASTL